MAAKAKSKPESAATEELVCSTIYLRHTNPLGSYITGHRVWNAKLFLASQFEAALKAGGSCEQVTQDDYVEWLSGQRKESRRGPN